VLPRALQLQGRRERLQLLLQLFAQTGLNLLLEIFQQLRQGRRYSCAWRRHCRLAPRGLRKCSCLLVLLLLLLL
jgi:hypothetical protein